LYAGGAQSYTNAPDRKAGRVVDSVREQRNARHRLKALLLRNGIAYSGKATLTGAYVRWLATVKMEHAAQQIGFQEYLHSITESAAGIERLEQAR
jgi:hypothetical protein